MKKIFLLLISALLIFCLVACDKFSTSSKDKDDDTESGEEMENSGSELGESGTLDTEDSYTQGSVSTPDTWNSGSAMGSSVTTDTSGVDRENEIAVAFKLNGGTLHTGRTVVYLEKGSVIDVNIIPITTKDGSEFLGWAYDSNGLNMWDISHSFDKDTVLYAIWDVKTVSVSFDANGGETVTGSSFAEIKLGEALSGVPAVVREGFVFKGWAYDRFGNQMWSPADTFDKNTSLYAVWEEATVTVAFKVNGGAMVSGSLTVKVTLGGELTSVPTVERAGYRFVGWSYAPDDNYPWTQDDVFVADTDLYAVWEKETVTVAFRVNGGMIVDGDNMAKVPMGEALTAVPSVERSGYRLVGWSYTPNGSDPWEENDVFVVDTILYAIWQESGTTDSSGGTTDSSGGSGDDEIKKITVSFDANGGVLSFESAEIDEGTKLSYSLVPSATRDGYILRGWAYDPFGNELWSMKNDVFDSDTTLFAIWEKDSSGTTDTTGGGTTDSSEVSKSVGIIFNANGGSVAVDYTEVDYGSKLSYSNVPLATRDGYILKGWAYDPFGNDMWSARNDVFYEETELYAVWEKESSGTTDTSQGTTGSSSQGGSDPVPTETVTIEFDAGSGYFENSNDYEMEIGKGTRIPSFPVPDHEDPSMLFDGWYEDAALTVPASRSTKRNGDTVLYAKWIERTECSDGSYDHVWGSWDLEDKPTCTKDGTDSRYCLMCGHKEEKAGNPALGHNWNQWTEAFMRKERTCARLGCTEKDIVVYEDVTISVLGNNPGNQVSGNKEAFYDVPFTNMINGKWDDGYGEVVSLRGNGSAYVQFLLASPSVIDRIYFKGKGVSAVNVLVKYEGESDYTLIGVCSSSPDKESTPFASPDATRRIVAIKFVEDTPAIGQSMWQEVAFVKIGKND